MSSSVSQKLNDKAVSGVPLTTFEAWMFGGDAPSWFTPLTDAIDDLGRNRLFKSGAAGSNGEDVDGIYTLNMRGLSKALIGLDSTTESPASSRNHREYEGSLDNGSGETFSYTIEFGRGGEQTMGNADGADTQILTGGGGSDLISGGLADDIIAGNRGDDTIYAGAGQDFVKGGAGSDVIDGGDGNDYLVGDYADSDRHESRAGVRGGDTWNDLIKGGAGDDFIFGNQGDDTLAGGAGDDSLEGGSGDDVIDGGAGNDILIGNGGADTFIFEGDFGHDTIMDFEVDVDTLDITGWAGFHLSLDDGNTTIAFNGQSITLLGIVMNDGDWKDALGIEPVGNNYIIGSDGVIRDKDMTSLNVSDDIAQNVTVVVNDEYATGFTKQKYSETIKLGFGAQYGELNQALKGTALDVRTTSSDGDDIKRLLNEAFEDDGFDLGGGNMVGVQIVDMDTVKMSFTVGGVTDTVTVTGAYVDGYLDTMFDGKNAVIDDGVLVGLKAGAFDADDNVSENATLIVNIAGPDDIKFNFGTEIRNLVSDINKGEYLDHRDATDDLTYLVQAVFNPDDETVSDRVSGEQINKDTVVISINSPDGGAVDTLTLTGDYIEDLLV